MSVSCKLVMCLAALAAAGCATPRQQAARDWEDLNAPPSKPPAQQPSLAAPVTLSQPGSPLPRPPLPGTAPIATGWVPLQRWARTSGLAAPNRLPGNTSPTYALRSTNGVLTLRSGSQLAYWGGLEVHLGFAPQMIDGQPYVHALDMGKVVQALLLGPGLFLNAHPVIVIDPGHGGENAGTRSVLSARYEKEFTLDWARRLQALLTANGWQVFLTRSNDSDLALSNRVAVANRHKADVFVSLHFNSAAPNEEEAGLETYCLTPAGMPSSLTRGADEIGSFFPNNAFDQQNLHLAVEVHRALLQVNGHHDRGVRYARFPGVLRNQQRPAVLIEGGYLSNPREARLISDPAYRQQLALAVARALSDRVVSRSLAQASLPQAEASIQPGLKCDVR